MLLAQALLISCNVTKLLQLLVHTYLTFHTYEYQDEDTKLHTG
jgi:hypothetical protein